MKGERCRFRDRLHRIHSDNIKEGLTHGYTVHGLRPFTGDDAQYIVEYLDRMIIVLSPVLDFLKIEKLEIRPNQEVM